MKLAIMQPYLFPYLGYFQLIHSVDVFVLYDDVNFITRGWINRNRILLDKKAHLFTLPLIKASQNKKINDIYISNNDKHKMKLLKTIMHAYSKAPEFKNIIPMIEEILSNEESSLSNFIEYSLVKICDYLDIKTKLVKSSSIQKKSLKGEDKIIEICRFMGANIYINPIGGASLYDKEVFSGNNIKLYFLSTNTITYDQGSEVFVPNLSIIDLLMFNKKDDIMALLNEYKLL